MAAPVFGSVGVVAAGSGDTVTITAPASIADNDILLAVLTAEPSTQTITPPAGFASVAKMVTPDGISCEEVFWKRASSESGNYAFTETGNNWGDGLILRISGAITTGDPCDVVGADGAGHSASPVAATVTTTVDDTLLCFLMAQSIGSVTATPPTGMTERSDSGNVYAATETLGAAGATGTRTGTLSSSSWWGAVLVAIKPPAAGGADPEGSLLHGKLIRGGLLRGGVLA